MVDHNHVSQRLTSRPQKNEIKLSVCPAVLSSGYGNRQNAREKSTMKLLDGAFLSVDCPRCGYAIDVELVSIRLESTIFCPCCKGRIQLVDGEASLHRAQKEIERAINNFSRNL